MIQKPQKAKKKAETGELVVAQNRSASYHYVILEKFEAGMVLRGTEVKAIRMGKANVREAYALVRGGELWLENCHIAEYDSGGVWNHSPLSTRKLLMHKEEIRKIFGKTQQKGLTLIALRLYLRGGRVKIELALARGKKDWDRRDQERNKEAEREAKQAIYNSPRR